MKFFQEIAHSFQIRLFGGVLLTNVGPNVRIAWWRNFFS